MRRKHLTRFRSGFTLIELLVVIAIIALLAAILFPVFASAKRSAKKTTSLSNLDQIGKAVHLYLGDSDDTLPFRFGIEPKWNGYDMVLFQNGPGFTQTYAPYLKDTHVWFSPEDRLKNPGFTSYAMNEQLSFAWPMSAIPRPAEAIYLADRTDIDTPISEAHGPVDTYVWWSFANLNPFKETMLPGVIDPISVASQIDPIRYVGNVGAYMFLDSHVATMPFERTWGDASHNLHLATKA